MKRQDFGELATFRDTPVHLHCNGTFNQDHHVLLSKNSHCTSCIHELFHRGAITRGVAVILTAALILQ